MEELFLPGVLVVIFILLCCWLCHSAGDDQVEQRPNNPQRNGVSSSITSRNGTSYASGDIPLQQLAAHPTHTNQKQNAGSQQKNQVQDEKADSTSIVYENITYTAQNRLPLNIPMEEIPGDNPSSAPKSDSTCIIYNHLSQSSCEELYARALSNVKPPLSINDLSQNKSLENPSTWLNPQQATPPWHLPRILPPSLPDLAIPTSSSSPINNYTNNIQMTRDRIVYHQNLPFPDLAHTQSVSFVQSNYTTSICRSCRRPLCKCSSDDESSRP